MTRSTRQTILQKGQVAAQAPPEQRGHVAPQAPPPTLMSVDEMRPTGAGQVAPQAPPPTVPPAGGTKSRGS